MAYAAVASLLQTIDLLLNYHQLSISPEFRNQIMSIHQHTCFLQLFIEGSSARVNNWEETIREVTNRAEDIIELLLSDSLLELSVGSSRSDESERGKYEVSHSFDELEKIADEIELIVNRVKGGRRVETSYSTDKELMEIISRLLRGSSSLERIAICGSGGMGKTTLAERAYYHPLVVEHFDVRAWSTVTREYIRVRVIRDLLLFMKGDNSTSDTEDALIESLLQNLGRKRYLIVVDDVWSNDVLERLKMALPDYGNGSRIIFTTQSSDVATESAHHVHEMRLLDDDESWDVLRDKIFEGDPCPFQLESTGKMIAKSCRGHQLSIAVVSGILAADLSEAAWDDVSENIKIVSEDGDRLYELLYLSYLYLPHHLRPCFLYLGIFPEGAHIYVSRLIKLWVAEGFVNECGTKCLEELGEEYVEDLYRRSLVFIHRRKSNGRIKSIGVHDLIRDLGCWIRSIRLLRVLDLLNINNYHLSEEVFELFHLRYLAFYREFYIPEAISSLQNLQTLIICHVKKGGIFDDLPEGILRMPQLRHLFVLSFKFSSQKGLPYAIENLQTLSRVVDFICSGENLKMISNLKKLDLLYYKNLREVVEDYEIRNLKYLQKLEILKIEMNLSFGEEHKMSWVFPPTLKKLSLCGLQLSWEDTKIFDSLPNLEVLKLRKDACIGDTWETSEGGFPRLTFLLIEEPNLEKWIAKSGHFPRLERLMLLHCSSLLEVPYEMADIPTLQLIYLDDTNHSLLRSAERIQQDRHSLGHDPLQICVV